MVFKNNGSEIAVKFDHRDVELKTDTGTVKRRATRAEVFVDNEFHSVGVAYCHPHDNFCRETGRQVALTKAIQNFDKSLRTTAWDTYRVWGKQRF